MRRASLRSGCEARSTDVQPGGGAGTVAAAGRRLGRAKKSSSSSSEEEEAESEWRKEGDEGASERRERMG